ncbi:MAG TPA: hypothetical protein VGQ04_02110 [Chitinophagaceae bacterium]|jgi:hypothetical protein|nr:hypothetical protein [Chitinophagaceae bacterium]
MKKILKKILKTILLFAGTIIGLLLLYIVFNLNLFHKRKILSSTEIKTYLQDIDKESSDPFKYVADKFNNHSVVFLGELHKRKQDLEFFSNLIPYLYQTKKIKIIGWEFGAAEYQKNADSVVTASEFDRKKAIAIMRNSLYYWCYEEYLNIFKTIWQINKTITQDDEKIRFLQLNRPYNPKLLKSPDRNISLEEIKKGNFDNTLPGIVEKEVIQQNKKILIYCGLHHSLTKFKTPKLFFIKDKGRAGQILFEKYPDKIFQICLLPPFPPRWFIYKELTHNHNYKFVYPFDAVFNQLYDTLKRPFAVNSDDPVFDNLKDYNSFYAFDTWGGIKFKNFCDGIIMLNSFDKIAPIRFITDWVTTEEELNEIKNVLPEEDAKQIKSIPDLINYINPTVDINGVREFHNLNKFWK